jgi:hypothetical protein
MSGLPRLALAASIVFPQGLSRSFAMIAMSTELRNASITLASSVSFQGNLKHVSMGLFVRETNSHIYTQSVCVLIHSFLGNPVLLHNQSNKLTLDRVDTPLMFSSNLGNGIASFEAAETCWFLHPPFDTLPALFAGTRVCCYSTLDRRFAVICQLPHRHAALAHARSTKCAKA